MAYEILDKKSYDFALRIVNLYKYLKDNKNNYGLGDQIVRSGTSIGANISEGIFSQSNSDNIAKFTIALKEANETRYWLRLLRDAGVITKEQGDSLIEDCAEIIKILVASIKTLKNHQ